jgi:putative ABC transport system permease protein
MRQPLRGALVVVEVALAVVLLVGAALFLGSFINLMRVESGFKPESVLTLQVFSRVVPGQPRRDLATAFDEIVDRVRQTHGVVHASAVYPGTPLVVNMWINGFDRRERTVEGDRAVSIKVVLPDYHRALGIPLKSGRFFDETDIRGQPNALIISESAARRFFGTEDPIGKLAVIDNADRTVVGIVGDVRQFSLETPSLPEVYFPMRQSQAVSGFLVVRTSVDPYAVLPAVKSALFDVLPDVPPRRVTTMDALIARQTAQRRLNMLMLGLFGLVGLVISVVGVYGVMACAVSQRTREIGIRMALGATRSQVVGMVLIRAAVLVGAGVLAGGLVAWYLGETAKRFLFGLEAYDPRAYFAAAVVLCLAALTASAVPARRAASVDPTVALRAE